MGKFVISKAKNGVESVGKNAQDVMMGAPSFVEQKQLDELHIVCVEPEEE